MYGISSIQNKLIANLVLEQDIRDGSVGLWDFGFSRNLTNREVSEFSKLFVVLEIIRLHGTIQDRIGCMFTMVCFQLNLFSPH